MVYEVETIYDFDLLVIRNTGCLHHTKKVQYYEDNDNDN
jgi:hypothetical protein